MTAWCRYLSGILYISICHSANVPPSVVSGMPHSSLWVFQPMHHWDDRMHDQVQIHRRYTIKNRVYTIRHSPVTVVVRWQTTTLHLLEAYERPLIDFHFQWSKRALQWYTTLRKEPAGNQPCHNWCVLYQYTRIRCSKIRITPTENILCGYQSPRTHRRIVGSKSSITPPFHPFNTGVLPKNLKCCN